MTSMTQGAIHWALRSLAIVAVFGMVGMNLSGRETGPSSVRGCVKCVDGAGDDNCCEQCHSTFDESPNAAGPLHGACHTNTCAATHDECEQTLNELPELDESDLIDTVGIAVASQDAKELARLLRAAPRRVTINDTRQAVQLMDCDGEVVANFPTPLASPSAVASVDPPQR